MRSLTPYNSMKLISHNSAPFVLKVVESTISFFALFVGTGTTNERALIRLLYYYYYYYYYSKDGGTAGDVVIDVVVATTTSPFSSSSSSSFSSSASSAAVSKEEYESPLSRVSRNFISIPRFKASYLFAKFLYDIRSVFISPMVKCSWSALMK